MSVLGVKTLQQRLREPRDTGRGEGSSDLRNSRQATTTNHTMCARMSIVGIAKIYVCGVCSIKWIGQTVGHIRTLRHRDPRLELTDLVALTTHYCTYSTIAVVCRSLFFHDTYLVGSPCYLPGLEHNPPLNLAMICNPALVNRPLR